MIAQTIPLDEAFWFQEGPGVRKWQFTTSGIKLLNVGNICLNGDLDLSKTDRCLSREEVEKRYKHFLIDEGDLVIASSGVSFDDDGLLRTRGVFVERSHLPLCLNTSTIRFKPKGENDLRYLRYWLDSHEFRSQITRLVTGSAQQNFGPSHLESTRISLPSLTEQQRIAGLLERADRLRRTRRYALELSDNFLTAVFLELFGNSLSGKNHWPLTVLGELVRDGDKLNYGVVQPGDDLTEGVPIIRVADLDDLEASTHTLKRIAPEIEKKHSASRLVGDELLIGCVGSIGKIAKVTPRVCGFNIARAVARVRCNWSRINRDFLEHYLRSSRAQDFFTNETRTSSQPTLNITQIEETPVIEPPLVLQQKFATLVARHERLRATQREALRQAEHLFQTLLHRAFSEGV